MSLAAWSPMFLERCVHRNLTSTWGGGGTKVIEFYFSAATAIFHDDGWKLASFKEPVCEDFNERDCCVAQGVQQKRILAGEHLWNKSYIVWNKNEIENIDEFDVVSYRVAEAACCKETSAPGALRHVEVTNEQICWQGFCHVLSKSFHKAGSILVVTRDAGKR